MGLQIVFGIIFVIIAALLVLWLIDLIDQRRIASLWESLEGEPSGESFSPEMVEDLPGPAKRWLLHSIEPGTPLPGHVRFTMKGKFLPDPDAEPMPMRAEQILSVPRGLVWKASVGTGLTRIAGYDYYIDGEGGQKFKLWGLIPILKTGGEDVSRSAAGRVGGEAFLIPSSLLPSKTVVWDEIDENSSRVYITVGDERVEAMITADETGKLLKISLPRWSDRNPEKEFRYVRFEAGGFSEERKFGGFTIPTRFEAGWHPEDGDFEPFFLPVIEHMEYH